MAKFQSELEMEVSGKQMARYANFANTTRIIVAFCVGMFLFASLVVVPISVREHLYSATTVLACSKTV
jgi:hypothetical protein